MSRKLSGFASLRVSTLATVGQRKGEHAFGALADCCCLLLKLEEMILTATVICTREPHYGVCISLLYTRTMLNLDCNIYGDYDVPVLLVGRLVDVTRASL